MLFGFLLAIRFTGQFADLDGGERYAYYVTLILTVVALVLFQAPAAHHRLRFRSGDKEVILRKGNREAIVGTLAMALSLTGALYLVTDLVFGVWEAAFAAAAFFAVVAWRWWAVALARILRERGAPEKHAP